jgi:hypothetical protein
MTVVMALPPSCRRRTRNGAPRLVPRRMSCSKRAMMLPHYLTGARLAFLAPDHSDTPGPSLPRCPRGRSGQKEAPARVGVMGENARPDRGLLMTLCQQGQQSTCEILRDGFLTTVRAWDRSGFSAPAPESSLALDAVDQCPRTGGPVLCSGLQEQVLAELEIRNGLGVASTARQSLTQKEVCVSGHV